MAVTSPPLILLYFLLILLTMMFGSSETKSQKHRRLIIDHQVTHEDAIEAARKLLEQFDAVTPAPGCDRCSRAEIAYCMSTNALNDHCCCDRTHTVSTERFPWAEHTCYVTPNCQLVATDCEEFARVADCCCLRYNPTIYSALGSHASAPFSAISSLLVVLLVHLFKLLSTRWQYYP